MALTMIEENFPKTAAYINEVFDALGESRGGHHNYVVAQRICNFSESYGMTVAECEESKSLNILAQADEEFLARLKNADGSEL